MPPTEFRTVLPRGCGQVGMEGRLECTLRKSRPLRPPSAADSSSLVGAAGAEGISVEGANRWQAQATRNFVDSWRDPSPGAAAVAEGPVEQEGAEPDGVRWNAPRWAAASKKKAQQAPQRQQYCLWWLALPKSGEAHPATKEKLDRETALVQIFERVPPMPAPPSLCTSRSSRRQKLRCARVRSGGTLPQSGPRSLCGGRGFQQARMRR